MSTALLGRFRPYIGAFPEESLQHPRRHLNAISKRGVFHLSGPVPQVSLPWGPGSEWQGCGWSFLTVCVPCRHQLEMPGHYSHLAAFYEDKKGVLHAGPGRGGSLPPVYWLPSIHRYMYPEMKVGPPGSHTVPDVGLEQQL